MLLLLECEGCVLYGRRMMGKVLVVDALQHRKSLVGNLMDIGGEGARVKHGLVM